MNDGIPSVANRVLRRAALVLSLIFPALLFAQDVHRDGADLVTDRPDITESSIVVPKGSLQFENGFTWTSDHGTRTLDASETLIRLGVSDRFELRVAAPNYLESLAGSFSGFGDLSLGFKQQIGPLPGDVELSVIVAVSLPSGAAHISSHGFDPFVKLPWSKELRRGWSIGGMQSLFWSTGNRTRNLIWEPTVYVEREFRERAAAFLEYGADFPSVGGARHVAHAGIAYKLTRRQQIDFHFGFGLSPAAPQRFFAGGYSIRIDRLWHSEQRHTVSR